MNTTIKRIVIEALRRVGLTPYRGAGIWDGYTSDAVALAQWVDCDRASLEQPQQHPERVHPNVGQRSCNWYLPVFDNAFYGGIMTILRLAAHLQERDGVQQRFLICGACDPKVISARIGEAFSCLAKAEVRALDSIEAIQAIPASDYSVATLWTTAYVLLKVQNTGYKFYMIQDYEPLFYPAGSTYAQAELSYRFGFYGIANTISLRDIYQRDYGGRAVALTPSVDTSIFHAGEALSADGVKRLFYYARPGTPRNGFELAVAAFKLLKSRMGDRVEILCAGADWDPAKYGLDGIVRAVGMLPYAQTGDLYRSCHVGLVMMMTKHPSYLPFELMGCGTVVVSNVNPANTWFLKDGENCLLSEPTASCLAETLAEALEGYATLASMRQRAANEIQEFHGDWTVTMAHVSAFMHAPDLTHAE
jgi:glycosyltransferase involved in cell wall biosynthesis